MPNAEYFGIYGRFEPDDASDSALLVGADNIVGDFYDIVVNRGEDDRLLLRNRFGKTVGCLDKPLATQVQLCLARGWIVRAILSCVCFTDVPDPGFYWGEVAIISYPETRRDAFDAWTERVSREIANGTRIALNLSEEGVHLVLESNGTWLPSAREPRINPGSRSAVVKDHMTFSEGVIEQARARNTGCMVAGWMFIAALIIGVLWLTLRAIG